MKIFAISDLHLSENCNKPMNIFGPQWEGHFEKIKNDWNQKVQKEDVVLIAGDISWAMKLNEAIPDLELISALNGTKVIIRGNHDYWWQSISAVRNILPSSIKALQNDSITIGDFVICGTRGWTVPEIKEQHKDESDEKIYKRELLRLELSLKNAHNLINYSSKGKIKEVQNLEKSNLNKKLIVMLHYPPFNSKFEVSDFTRLLEKYNVNSVVYGHLHGKGSRIRLTHEINGIKYYLTSCDKLNNKLIEIV